ncbi:MAG: TnsA endonuclease N-terminal domain-containing protein [Dissulfurispiraceae bacterium]
MARKRYGLTEARISRFIREGRGIGTGKNYKPFWTVGDVPSCGRVHRVYCPITEREHHLLSDNEYYAFLLQWWRDDVIDIREQFPFLDRRETLEIAARCGVPHPVDPHSGALWVLTTDIVITVRTSDGTELFAYAVKDAEALCEKRTLEKLEIERRYWERHEVQWSILTNQQVKCTFTKNLAWILSSYGLSHIGSSSQNLDLNLIRRELATGQLTHPQMPIRLLCSTVDRRLNYRSATTLGVLRQLLGAKVIGVDLHARHLQDLPARSFLLKGGPEWNNIIKM